MDKTFQNKRVLITGATGLIGSHLAKRLVKEGASVIAMGRSQEKLNKVFEKQLMEPRFSTIVGNIADQFPAGITDVDYIFHTASPISGTEIKTKPVDTIAANIDGTRRCLEFLKSQERGRMVIFSSATVYGNQYSEDVSYDEASTDKADALNTDNTPYSESKRMIEVIARAYAAQYQVDSVIVRIGYVYGFIDPMPNTAFYEFMGKAVRGEDIILNNSGMGRRDNIHVDDVVEGILVVVAKGECGESYNVSSNGDMNNFRAIDEIAGIIADSANEINPKFSVRAQIKPMEGERKPGMCLNNARLRTLGWKVSVGLEEGIKDSMIKLMSRVGQ